MYSNLLDPQKPSIVSTIGEFGTGEACYEEHSYGEFLPIVNQYMCPS